MENVAYLYIASIRTDIIVLSLGKSRWSYLTGLMITVKTGKVDEM